jgi:hypothetical protein
MTELLQAIKTRYDGAAGAALRAATPGGIWLGVAPPTVQFPFVMVAVLDGGFDYAMGSVKYETYDVEMSVFDDDTSPSDAIAAGLLLTALFDDQLLTMSTYRMITAESRGYTLVEEPDRNGWAVHVRYTYMIGLA